jgi:hypothetical protein
MAQENKQILLAQKPTDKLSTDNFKLVSSPMPEAGPGEVLCKSLYLSLDAANRAWMQGKTYRDEIGSGDVMAGGALAEVITSNDPKFKVGDLVEADAGWQEFFVKPANQLQARTRHEPLTNLLSVLGVTGKTAYFGLLNIGDPKPGETVVVSAAGGAVGSIVGQIAKIKGARVVGVASGAEKCAWLVNELGYDAVIDHREENIFQALKENCPDGIDVYFDNVGGPILEAVLFRMNMHGRIICCGAVSQYDTGNPGPGPRGVPGLLVTKRLTMQGFIVMDFYKEIDKAETELSQWVAEGKLKVPEDVIEGLENAPAGLVGLLAGENRGKRMIKVAND